MYFGEEVNCVVGYFELRRTYTVFTDRLLYLFYSYCSLNMHCADVKYCVEKNRNKKK